MPTCKQVFDSHAHAGRAIHVHPGKIPARVRAAKGHEWKARIQQAAHPLILQMRVGQDEAVHLTFQDQRLIGDQFIGDSGRGKNQEAIAAAGGGRNRGLQKAAVFDNFD